MKLPNVKTHALSLMILALSVSCAKQQDATTYATPSSNAITAEAKPVPVKMSNEEIEIEARRLMDSMNSYRTPASFGLAQNDVEVQELPLAIKTLAATFFDLTREIVQILFEMRDQIGTEEIQEIKKNIDFVVPLLTQLGIMGIDMLSESGMIPDGFDKRLAMAFLNHLPQLVDGTFNLMLAVFQNIHPGHAELALNVLQTLVDLLADRADIFGFGLGTIPTVPQG